ncbi:hypothetical protein ACFL1Y_00850 [Patescibacteria group bacterium]
MEKEKLTQEELLWKIYESTEKTRKYILWGKILSIIKILIIVIPIVLAIIYLPPYIEKVTAPYQELLETTNQGKEALQGFSLDELLRMYK